MKKAFLSLTVIISFALYALNERFGGSVNQVVYQAPGASNQTGEPSQPVATKPKPPKPVPAPTAPAPKGAYRDGQYIGNSVDVYYGNVQVKAIISGGKLTDVQFLDYPHDRSTSLSIANYAMPILRSEAISAQSANVDGVSGATHTSAGFVESLGGALAQAKS